MREQAQGRLEMLDERIDRLTEQLHEARRCSYFYTWRTALFLFLHVAHGVVSVRADAWVGAAAMPAVVVVGT